MIVAGDHANNDICGNGDDTWKTKLLSKRVFCQNNFKGVRRI